MACSPEWQVLAATELSVHKILEQDELVASPQRLSCAAQDRRIVSNGVGEKTRFSYWTCLTNLHRIYAKVTAISSLVALRVKNPAYMQAGLPNIY